MKQAKKQVKKPMAKRKAYSDKVCWADLRDEYISQGVSMRALERKYGVPVTTISRRARKENWAGFAKDLEEKVSQETGTGEKIIAQRLDNNLRAQVIVDELLKKLETAVKNVNSRDAGSLKQLATSMNVLKDIGAFDYGAEAAQNAVNIQFTEETEEFTE